MKIGQAVRIYPTASEYTDLVGMRAVIVRELGDDERDPEVGRMYEVAPESDNLVPPPHLQVFEDELEVL